MARRGVRWLLVFVPLALAGCTRTEDYVEVIQSQQKALEELNGVLKKIQTSKDLAAAHDELEDCCTRFEKIARKARDLPKPPPPEVANQVDVNAFTRLWGQIREQVNRIKGLDGGEDFFRNFEGHSSLFARSD